MTNCEICDILISFCLFMCLCMCLCFCWITPAALYLLSAWIGITVDTATFDWIAFGDLVDGEVGRVEVWIVSNCRPWVVLDCRVQSSEGVISLVLPAWIRGDIKYYFADSVRKGSTRPPPFTDKIFAKQKLRIFGVLISPL